MKQILSLIAAVTVVLSLAACGKQEAPVPPESAPAVTQAAEEAVFTGILEDKKDFMITVTGEDGNAYVFTLDGISCPAEVGQTVSVTYTGELSDFDSQLIALKIEKQ